MNDDMNKEAIEERLNQLKNLEEHYNDVLVRAASEGRIGAEHKVFYDTLASIDEEERKLQAYLDQYIDGTSEARRR